MNNELTKIPIHADAAALMLAAVDDRAAMSSMLKTLKFSDLPDLLLAAVEVGGTMVRLGDDTPDANSRDILNGMLAAFREVLSEEGPQ